MHKHVSNQLFLPFFTFRLRFALLCSCPMLGQKISAYISQCKNTVTQLLLTIVAYTKCVYKQVLNYKFFPVFFLYNILGFSCLCSMMGQQISVHISQSTLQGVGSTPHDELSTGMEWP